MEKKINHNFIISLAALIIAVGVGYYFMIALPKINREKLQLERDKYDEEVRTKNLEASAKAEQAKNEAEKIDNELAKKVQDDCMEKAKNINYAFDSSSVTPDPMFFPYEDIDSFNKNERILNAIDAYKSCITNDPRYNKENEAMSSLYVNSLKAWLVINQQMTSVKKKNPEICNNSEISVSAKKMCNEIKIE